MLGGSWIALGTCRPAGEKATTPQRLESPSSPTFSDRVTTAPATSSKSYPSEQTNAPTSQANAKQAEIDGLFDHVPAAQKQHIDVMAKMCRVAITAGHLVQTPRGYVWEDGKGAGPYLGCKCCAPFSECPPTGSTTPELVDSSHVYGLRHYNEGSYTKPGAKQIAATLFGCEPGMANRGGTVVLEPDGDLLKPVNYLMGANMDECENFASPDGRDRYLCTRSDGQASSWRTTLYLLDLAAKQFNAPALAVLNFDQLCLLEVGDEFVQQVPVRHERSDINGDGRIDLTWHITHLRTRVSKELRARCKAMHDDQSKANQAPMKPYPVALQFVQAASGQLVPTPNTRAKLSHSLAPIQR